MVKSLNAFLLSWGQDKDVCSHHFYLTLSWISVSGIGKSINKQRENYKDWYSNS